MKNRLLLAPLVAAALLAAAVIVSPAADAGAAATKTCPNSGLVSLVEVPGSGAAGSIYYKLDVTNLSGSTCTVSGYPKVSAVGLTGKRIGAPASHSPEGKVKQVKLGNGETATATLRITDNGAFSPNECKPVTAAGVRVTVPGSSGSKIAPLPFGTCALTSVKILSVGPLAAVD